jgi:glycosyltransferase involved in cell wall biosynthesis
MKIGIDAHVLGKNLGGVERFVAELVKQLPQLTPEHQYVIFVTKSMYKKLQSQSSSQLQYAPLAFANPLIERLILLPWLVRKYRLDALMIQRLAPWFCGQCKLIVTIHDLTPIKFADSYKGLSNVLVRLLTKNSILRADLILTPTKTIQSEIQQYTPEVKAPIFHFYNGVDLSRFTQSNQQKSEKTPPYLLTVGAIERRKNLETIISMMGLLNHPTMQLMILGGVRDQAYLLEIQQQITDLNLGERVHFLGFLDEKSLIEKYQQAEVFITASKDEGFNIPPLEAMACHVPVVCSDIPVHQELFEGVALFYETNAAQDLCEKVEALLKDKAQATDLASKAKLRTAHFNWQQTALNVANAFKALVR